MSTFHIWTLGCQMNQADSLTLAAGLERLGYHAVEDDAAADLVVINTCSVRQHAEDRAYGRLGILRQRRIEGSAAKIVVMGCMVGPKTDDLRRRFPYVDEWARECEQRGAGEILLTAIDRDGALQGYDIALVKRVVDAVRIPVIALGGCGNWKHAADVLKIADGACTQNIYHFTEASIKGAKNYLNQHGVPVRVS